MNKQIKDKPLSELIVELQQKYEEENNQSDMFQKLYHQALEQEESSTESSNMNPAILSNSTSSSQVQNRVGINKNIKKDKRNKIYEESSDKDTKNTITDKKQIQMLRNRISAQNSRDRKKAYLQKLEEDFNKQSFQINDLADQVSNLTQQLEEVNKQNQYYVQQLQNLTCLNCGSKQFGYDEEAPISVSRTKGLGKLGFSFLVIMTIFAIITLNIESKPQKLNIVSQDTQYKQLNQSDNEYEILSQLQLNRIKGMTDLIEYNQQFNYQTFDTSYKAIMHSDDSFVNGMINLNKERAKTKNKQALAPLNYHKQSVDSLYCPSVFKYENRTQQIQVEYQDDQWIHLIIPKNNYSIFYQTDEKSIILKELFQENNERQRYQEIWCQVKSVSDFYL